MGIDTSYFIILRGCDHAEELEQLLSVDDADVFFAYIPVGEEHTPDNAEAELMVLDPLKLLSSKFKEVGTFEEGWTATVTRVNAEEPIHNPGLHHLVVSGHILKQKKQVHSVVFRSVVDP